MRKEFAGYYAPSEEDLAQLWSNGVVVFDTNVLLHPYQVPQSTTDQVLDLFELLKGRVWVPHQVGLEYQRNRMGVIARANRASTKAQEELRSQFNEYANAIEALQLSNRGAPEADASLESMKSEADKILAAVARAFSAQLRPDQEDPIRARLDKMLEGAIGAPPESQVALDSIFKEAARRYQHKMGPGFKDQAKEGTFMSHDLVFDRRYSDYLIWKQIIDHAEKDGVKDLIFVTSDEKSDWWAAVPNSGRLEPQPELVAEMMRIGRVERFWMYTFKSFMDESVARLKAQLSPLAIEDAHSAEEKMQEDGNKEASGSLRFWSGALGAATRVITDEKLLATAAEDLGVELLEVAGGIGYATEDGKGKGVILLRSAMVSGIRLREALRLVQDRSKELFKNGQLDLVVVAVHALTDRTQERIVDNVLSVLEENSALSVDSLAFYSLKNELRTTYFLGNDGP